MVTVRVKDGLSRSQCASFLNAEKYQADTIYFSHFLQAVQTAVGFPTEKTWKTQL